MTYEFSIPEVEYFKVFCNFTDKEIQLFNLRAKGIPLTECAEIMKYESVKNLSRKVNCKILKVLDKKKMDAWINNVYWPSVINNGKA